MGSPRLSSKGRTLLEDAGNERLLSMASLWEMAVKVSIGKLTLTEPFEVLMPRELSGNGIEILPIQFADVAAVVHLPFHHRDPSDRLIIARAKMTRLPVLGNDEQWDAYGIERIW